MADPWFAHRRPNPAARVRLVCLPFAGGGASTYRAWVGEMPREIEVWPVELPGRETRFSEAPPGDLLAIVDAIVDRIAREDARPVALFGHSLGALSAFEIARSLHARGRTPVWLFASGARGPDVPRRNPPIADLPHDEFVKKLGEYQGTPREVLEQKELIELLVPLLRSDFRLAERYEYRPGDPLPCPISALGGVADRDVTTADLDAWKTHTSAEFSRHLFPGNHFFLASARADIVRLVAQRLLPR